MSQCSDYLWLALVIVLADISTVLERGERERVVHYLLGVMNVDNNLRIRTVQDQNSPESDLEYDQVLPPPSCSSFSH